MHAADAAAGDGRSVLVVDDDPQIREITVRILETHGYTAVAAANGAEAVAKLIGGLGQIRAIVVDMAMPVLDGGWTIEALRWINRDVPIIPTSGEVSDEKLRALAVQMGTTYLRKPFTAEELIAAVSIALDRRSEMAGNG